MGNYAEMFSAQSEKEWSRTIDTCYSSYLFQSLKHLANCFSIFFNLSKINTWYSPYLSHSCEHTWQIVSQVFSSTFLVELSTHINIYKSISTSLWYVVSYLNFFFSISFSVCQTIVVRCKNYFAFTAFAKRIVFFLILVLYFYFKINYLVRLWLLWGISTVLIYFIVEMWL